MSKLATWNRYQSGGDMTKKAKCPYCEEDLELDITGFCRWTIRAKCKKCRQEIDFGFLPPLKPVAWLCGNCGKPFSNMALNKRGQISPCCGAKTWTPLYQKELAEGTMVM